MRWIEQRFALFNGLDVLNHRAKFGEYRTTRMFVCLFVRFFLSRFESGGPFARVGYILNNYFVADHGSILILFLPFSEMIALPESLDSSYFCR